MRLTVNMTDKEYQILKEMSEAFSRSISSQIKHLAMTNNEVVGYRILMQKESEK